MQRKIKLKHGENYYIRVLLQETQLREIMTEKPVTIHENDPFSDIPKKFDQHRIRHLPVIDDSHKLVGLISQRDLYKIQPPHKLVDGTEYYSDGALNRIMLKHVMVKDVFTMRPADSIGDALLVMVQKKHGCIPIVNDDRVLCGIITQIDILSVAAQIYEEE